MSFNPFKPQFVRRVYTRGHFTDLLDEELPFEKRGSSGEALKLPRDGKGIFLPGRGAVEGFLPIFGHLAGMRGVISMHGQSILTRKH